MNYSARVAKWPSAVKPKRRYDSPRRREQAAATRREILDAAQRLFEQQGYAATTMAAIAARGRRRAEDRLPRLRDQERRAAGAVEPAAARRRRTTCPSPSSAWYREVLERARPRAPAAPQRAQLARRQGARRRAARGHPRRRARRPRHRGAVGAGSRPTSTPTSARSSRASRPRTRCGPASTSTRATDILWTLNHPDVWQLLVGQRGWTPDEYERWFADTAVEQLLGRRAA